jgi:ATP-binding cassette, subfamily B, multidrug efflux pump
MHHYCSKLVNKLFFDLLNTIYALAKGSLVLSFKVICISFLPSHAMKHLYVLYKYFIKYKKHFFGGILFVIISNYFGVLAPQLTGYIVDRVQVLVLKQNANTKPMHEDGFVKVIVHWVNDLPVGQLVTWCALIILLFALLRGFFMFLMRQTLIVMSRHIEFDQKNEIYNQYQKLDTAFFKVNSTGDLMNRIAEDVSRVRMYTGPAIMYLTNLVATIGFSLFYMFQVNASLTWIVILPLPILAITIYFVNSIINKKSEQIQEQLGELTSNAQESYSGIRVIKSFVQEKSMLQFFEQKSDAYKKSAVSLAKTEAVYFPSMALMIGLSTILTIYKGAQMHLSAGVIVEFVMYINMLTFPVSAIGWVASMIQRAAASQKRINEFMQLEPKIASPANAVSTKLQGDIVFENVDFTYDHTGIQALKNLNMHVHKGEKVAIIGRTGTGKSTIAQLILRMYDVQKGSILLDGVNVQSMPLQDLRQQISYVPQDVFLFSDDVQNNISFGMHEAAQKEVVEAAAKAASIHNEIGAFQNGYATQIGERGVTLSGGQKQRISIARALIKDPQLVIFDDCLSAVDAKTEREIVQNLSSYLSNKTALIITHRIFSAFHFDQIFVLEDGAIAEQGTHEALMDKNGIYAEMYERQQQEEKSEILA